MKRWSLSCAYLLVLASSCTHSAPQQPVHSKASLVIAQSAAAPGSIVNVGIQFVTENGWHIYWQNPGDSGEPPRVQWQLPSGVTATALEWPTPTRMTSSAGTDYGYQGTTVLLTLLQIPPNAQPGSISVGGDLRWLACHDICVPQNTQLKAPIRIASTTSVNGGAQQLLKSAAARLPQPLPASFQPVATSSPNGFRLALASSESITQAEFFPGEEAQIDNSAPQQFAAHPGGVSLVVKKSEYLSQMPQRLRGVLVLNGRDAYQVDAPVRNSSSSKGSHP
jgi:DsbC/DsbD-like thiol-disulfide interchange protein